MEKKESSEAAEGKMVTDRRSARTSRCAGCGRSRSSAASELPPWQEPAGALSPFSRAGSAPRRQRRPPRPWTARRCGAAVAWQIHLRKAEAIKETEQDKGETAESMESVEQIDA